MNEQWLSQYINYEKIPKNGQFSLDTISFLVEKMKHPEESFNSIHIAGSKGKGSVSAYIAAILHEYGINEGLYTSPHLVDFRERIANAFGFLDEDVYERAFLLLHTEVNSVDEKEYPNELVPSWFELVTLYAFLCFKEAGVSWAVFETGLGGRFDATNVLKPRLSVLTHIELEHTEYLGNTLSSIAFEKAGIIKENTAVCAFMPSDKAVYDVFCQRAQELHAPLFFLDDYVESIERIEVCDTKSTADSYARRFFSNRRRILLKHFFQAPLELDLQMPGDIQAQNAALAALSVCVLFSQADSPFSVDKEKIERGLSKAYLPARFELCFPSQRVRNKQCNQYMPIILDGAHTVSSISHSIHTLFTECHESIQSAQVLFACAADKDASSIAPLFFQECMPFSHITLTLPGSIKKGDLPSVVSAFEGEEKSSSSRGSVRNISMTVEADYKKAIKNAIENAQKSNEILLVIGSFYLIAEVKGMNIIQNMPAK